MELINNLYKIKSIDKENKSFQIELLSESVIYKAHFPDMPITPGVCLIRIGTELMENFLGQSLSLIGVNNAKFLIAISPELQKCVFVDILKIDLEHNSNMKSDFIIRDAQGTIFAKLSLIYGLSR